MAIIINITAPARSCSRRAVDVAVAVAVVVVVVVVADAAADVAVDVAVIDFVFCGGLRPQTKYRNCARGGGARRRGARRGAAGGAAALGLVIVKGVRRRA